HPLDLLRQQDEGRECRGVVRLVLPGVLQRGLEVERLRHEAAAGGDLLDAGQRARGQEGDPQSAVGGEVLLRCEVVDVRLRDVDGDAAGGGGRVDDDERVVRDARRTLDGRRAARRGLVVRPRVHVDGVVDLRQGGGVRGRVDEGRVLEGRRRLRRPRELRAQLAELRVRGARADETARRRVPEGRGAAVAQDDLV